MSCELRSLLDNYFTFSKHTISGLTHIILLTQRPVDPNFCFSHLLWSQEFPFLCLCNCISGARGTSISYSISLELTHDFCPLGAGPCVFLPGNEDYPILHMRTWRIKPIQGPPHSRFVITMITSYVLSTTGHCVQKSHSVLRTLRKVCRHSPFTDEEIEAQKLLSNTLSMSHL